MRAPTLLLLLCTCLALVVAQEGITKCELPGLESQGLWGEILEPAIIDAESTVMELTDLQFQEVLDKSLNASSYVFAKVYYALIHSRTQIDPNMTIAMYIRIQFKTLNKPSKHVHALTQVCKRLRRAT
jgi:hypothetical protein